MDLHNTLLTIITVCCHGCINFGTMLLHLNVLNSVIIHLQRESWGCSTNSSLTMCANTWTNVSIDQPTSLTSLLYYIHLYHDDIIDM